MRKRYVSIWFRHLMTDWFSLRNADLKSIPFVLRTSVHGRMVITAANANAKQQGINEGMVLADARAIIPKLEVRDDIPDHPPKLLSRLAEWCIRFTPVAAIDPPDGLFFDATGCAHLWGGESAYLEDIARRLTQRGYDVRAAISDTPGSAWALARFGSEPLTIETGTSLQGLLHLPPEALRLETETVLRLHKLGLHQIKQFISIPRTTLRRRFGPGLLTQLDKASGQEMERLNPIIIPEPFQERLPCLEPIVTATGIEIALQRMLETLCQRLHKDQVGLRSAIFKCYRVDGKVVQIEVGTNRPTHHARHLFKLFELKLAGIEPGMGIELFTLEAHKTEEHLPRQEILWNESWGLADERLAELLDRISGKVGNDSIHRYIPAEHYWPERSFKEASSLEETAQCAWRPEKRRPVCLLKQPERIDVTAPIPDYPPMLFRYKGKLHKITKADGPERIEQEWWLQQGQHRDYYCVEDEDGYRYWLFRLGHYDDKIFQWYLHGYFP